MSSRPSNSGSNSVSDGKLRESQQASITRAGGSSIANSTVVGNAKPSVSQGLGLETSSATRVEYPDLTQGRHRKFMVGTSIALWVSTLPYLFIFIVYQVKRDNPNSFLFSFFSGVPERYLAYFIIAMIFIGLILLAPTVYPPIGRGGLAYPLYVLYFLCLFYAVFYFFAKQSRGQYLYNWDMIVLPLLMGFFYASFGAVITAAVSKRKVPKALAPAIGAGGVVLTMILFAFASQNSSPQLWITGLYIAFGAALGYYYAFDLEDMVLKRGTYYHTNEWFLGFIHIQTDMFFRLPRDLLFRKNKQEDVVQELEIAEPDAELK